MTKTPKPFYITTTLPYVNATPHVGHALEFVRADTVARYKKMQGFDVFFNTGTDEHGQKLLEAANKAGTPIEKYVEQNSKTFRSLQNSLGISSDAHFIRTTNPKHVAAAQEFWKLVNKNGYIYKAKYSAKYCVGCELEKTDSELVNGKCPEHLNLEIQHIDEENYFFKYSAFQQKLLDLYASTELVLPTSRFNEIKSFVERGLHDFSISRNKKKMSWGVEVPGDPEHVMYVWFDALVSYISTLDWTPESLESIASNDGVPAENNLFLKFWKNGTPVQYCGQDNLRPQSAMWQAMLMAAGLPPTHKIIVNGFVMGEGGVKMSKTLGNVIDPLELITKYGHDALRYYLLRHIHPFEGSPMSIESFNTAYEANLVNGLGNLTSRLMTMCEKYIADVVFDKSDQEGIERKSLLELSENFDNYRMDLSCEKIWELISELDVAIAETEPFKLVKTDSEKAKKLLTEYRCRLYMIAKMLEPMMPDTSRNICDLVIANKKPSAPLFPKVAMVVL